MVADLVIENALITTSRVLAPGGVAIGGGKLLHVGDVSSIVARERLDARGLILMPGAIDTQVHFREPGLEHKEDIESGTRAAIHGGVTSILEMPNTSPPTTDAAKLHDKLARASGRAWVNYGFFIGASRENVRELGDLESCFGCPGIKIFMGSSTGSLLVNDDELLEAVLRNGTRRCPVHAEDEFRNSARKVLISERPIASEHPFLRDAESARIATERILRLSSRTGRAVHILHVSTADEIPLLAEAKLSGLGTTAEVTPQHLFFSAPECYERLGTRAQMNPPIRSEDHRRALWSALEQGIFDVFGSDHAPHTKAEKDLPYPLSPSGMPGVQTLLPVLLNFVNLGLLPLAQVVNMTCEAPAKLYGLRGKGRLEKGFDADLLLVDLHWKRVVEPGMLQSKCGWSPYEGMSLEGWPRLVVINGQIVVRDDHRSGQPLGKPLLYDREESMLKGTMADRA